MSPTILAILLLASVLTSIIVWTFRQIDEYRETTKEISKRKLKNDYQYLCSNLIGEDK